MKKIKYFIYLVLLSIILIPTANAIELSSKELIKVDGDNVFVKEPTTVKNNYIVNYQQVYGASSTDTKFDLRNASSNSNVTSIKDQGTTSQCWIYSSLGSVESYLSYKNNAIYDLSVSHMEYATQSVFTDGTYPIYYKRTIGNPGNFFLSNGYMMNNIGPVKTSSFANVSTYPTKSLSEIMIGNDIDVNSTGSFGVENTESGRSIIKEMIIKKGSLMAMASAGATAAQQSVNINGAALYTLETEEVDHGVLIVGWDDDYSKNNFKTKPTIDGAWIVKNSWGTSYGDNGYMYISYADTHTYSALYYVDNIDTNPEDNSYYYDNLGPTNILSGFDTVMIKGSVNNTNEILKEISIGFYTEDTDVGYEIYFMQGDGTTEVLNHKVAEGTISQADHPGFGYITVELDNPIKLTDKNYVVAVKYIGEDVSIPLQMTSSTNTATFLEYDHPGENKTFYIYNGVAYDFYGEKIEAGTKMLSNGIPNIKIHTNNAASTSFGDPVLSYGNNNIYNYTSTITTEDYTTSNYSFKVVQGGNDVTSKFTGVFTLNASGSSFVIHNNDSSVSGTFTVTLTNGSYNKTYDITIYESPLISNTYSISYLNHTISKIKLNTKYSDFIKNFSIYEGTLKNGTTELDDSTILSTGYTITSNSKDYTIAVNGDLNKDGKSTNDDLNEVKNLIIGKSTFDEISSLASDVNNDGKINAIDALYMKRYILGLENGLY